MVMDDVWVCFVGDSFVAGVGDSEFLGWAGRLAAGSAGVTLTMYNLGVRRETSSDIRARWRAECTARIPQGCDGRVVFSFGSNDTTVENGATRVAPDVSVENLAAVLRECAASGWRPLVVGPPPMADVEQNERTARLDRRFADVCASAGVEYVGVFDALVADAVWMEEVRTGDGAHPDSGGYRAFASLVRPGWERWIGTAAAVQ
ncbi:G-D-S-L family lipolytic protein [Prescottella agglutinans]|uniref:G-D-S-L family lipolytic protein n=2 Tax=Prescottella agglutinans TaxID=1644129 RepID=A0A438BL50_9NOCA|nr:G-D-S-L family lipolytic protein [Prescottella agglutinans]